MRRAVTLPGLFWGLASGATILICLCADGFADDLCQGHRLLPSPRPATSCQKLIPQVYASPNGELQAVVRPAGVSLYATPDIESRVVIRSRSGDTLTSKDYSSPRGTMVYSRTNNVFAKLSDMIGGRPIMSGDFSISAPHTVRATTWKREGDMDNTVTVAVDLQAAFDKLPAAAN